MWTRKIAQAELTRRGQQHVLRYLDELSPEGQLKLLGQLESIDFDWLHRAASAGEPQGSRQIAPYRDIIGLDDARHDEAWRVGEQALKSGRVGVLLVAGGQGTRLGFDGPKGAFPLGPASARTLFQMHVERVIALGRRYGPTPPLYVMTSPANHRTTCEHFAEHGRYGLPEDRLLLFAQGVAPALSDSGKLLLGDRDSLVLTPNGNGGLFAAMRDSGAFEHMRDCGVDIISYLQVDNPLSLSADPRFVGYHLLCGSQFSCKAIAKLDPFERVGNYALVNDRPSIVEYTEIPDELATECSPDGRLLFGHGNPGLFIWSRGFAESQAARTDLPVHRAHKEIPCLNEHGRLVHPDRPNGFKLETFALDTLPDAETAMVLACDRASEFAPVKNASGADSPQSAQSLMNALYTAWVVNGGGTVAPGTTIEISPLYALDQAELAAKLPPNTALTGNVFWKGSAP